MRLRGTTQKLKGATPKELRSQASAAPASPKSLTHTSSKPPPFRNANRSDRSATYEVIEADLQGHGSAKHAPRIHPDICVDSLWSVLEQCVSTLEDIRIPGNKVCET